MNKLVEIDAKNQMAVVEPYVTAAQLQAEAMKVGWPVIRIFLFGFPSLLRSAMRSQVKRAKSGSHI